MYPSHKRTSETLKRPLFLRHLKLPNAPNDHRRPWPSFFWWIMGNHGNVYMYLCLVVSPTLHNNDCHLQMTNKWAHCLERVLQKKVSRSWLSDYGRGILWGRWTSGRGRRHLRKLGHSTCSRTSKSPGSWGRSYESHKPVNCAKY